MKKKLYVLATFIVLNVAALSSLNASNNLYVVTYVYTEPVKETTAKADVIKISLSIDVKNEILIVKATHALRELALFDLYDKKLVEAKEQNVIRLTNLTRGVYFLRAKIKGNNVSKKIILQ